MWGSARKWWSGLPRRRKLRWVLWALAVLACIVAALNYMATSDGIDPIDPEHPVYSYVAVFALIALDAVIPILPGETTLNAAATAAAQGNLDLTWVIVSGALGAVVGDSALFWLARRYSARVEPLRQRAQANDRIREALALMDSSAGTLIVGGRYVPGMRFVVNATMGLSQIPYRRFLLWSALSGVLWSAYTSILAYQIGIALGGYPLASILISGVVTSIALGLILVSLRRHKRAGAAARSEPRKS